MSQTHIRCWFAPWPDRRAGWDWVRCTLAEALGADVAALDIGRETGGKPRLGPLWDGWDFSLSHSRDAALLALAHNVAVGADLEWPRPRGRLLALADRYFTRDEAADLRRCPEAQQLESFYALWTSKEAVLKAAGVGISHGLDRVGMRRSTATNWHPAMFSGALEPASAWQLATPPLPRPWVARVGWRGSPRLLQLIVCSAFD